MDHRSQIRPQQRVLQCINNSRWGTEIGISDPHRNDVFVRIFVPFLAITVTSVDPFIKIECHSIHPLVGLVPAPVGNSKTDGKNVMAMINVRFSAGLHECS